MANGHRPPALFTLPFKGGSFSAGCAVYPPIQGSKLLRGFKRFKQSRQVLDPLEEVAWLRRLELFARKWPP
jgi:hypothetical protein